MIWGMANFLHFVDHQIYSKGLGLLKLSLYPSEGLTWSKLEASKCPSDIFHLLKDVSVSEEFALQKCFGGHWWKLKRKTLCRGSKEAATSV